MNPVAKRFAEFTCRIIGHVWQRRKSVEFRICKRCGKVLPIKRRKSIMPEGLINADTFGDQK